MSESESIRDRLARLRRDSRAPLQAQPGTQQPAPGKLPAWLQRTLASKRAQAGRAQPAAALQPSSPKSMEALRRMQRASNEHGSYSLRETIHPESMRHGAWPLHAVDAALGADIALLSGDESLKNLDLRRAIYLDVETTGLSGGAGTTSFMVALGRFEGRRFHLWQGFLEGPEEERAMLFEVAERVRAADGIVSFFGKSFDRHRLEDKMRLHHLQPPFEGTPHLDLYHPLHRLYKRSVPNGRLCTMEQTLCDVRRLDDLPGSYAPEAWFDYLGKRAHRLEAVFRHNAEDVLSLVTLAAHLGRGRLETRADGSPLSGSSAARALAWAQLQGKRGNPEQALEWLQLAVERAPVLLEDRELGFLAALWNRQAGQPSEAQRRFGSVAGEHADGLAARSLVELAKLREHAAGAGATQWRAALLAVERAQDIVGCLPGSKALSLAKALKQRAARLRGKLERAEANSSATSPPLT